MRKHLLFFIPSLVICSFIGISTNLVVNSPMDGKRPDGSNDLIKYQYVDQSVPQVKDPGIGPVKKVELGPLNKKLADDGKNIYNNKCLVCHELDQKKIGPPLRTITKERTPEYIMNLLVNYVQMQKEDPVLKDTYKKFNNLPMPDPALNQSQARSVLEYLRSVAN
jgi:cytochrome c551/c552